VKETLIKKYLGIIVDVISRWQFKGEITVENGKILLVNFYYKEINSGNYGKSRALARDKSGFGCH